MIGNLIFHVLMSFASNCFSVVDAGYTLFHGLATTRLFTSETVQSISNNLYILVSVVILFAFSVKLIEAIVNPDLLTDSKKGVTGVLKRTIIGLILIVAIPNIFNFLYYFQAEIITNGLVEKVILGYTSTDSDSSTANAGKLIISEVITGLVYPIDATGDYTEKGQPLTREVVCGDDENCNYAQKLIDINPEYEHYVSFLGTEMDYSELENLARGASLGQGITGEEGAIYRADAGGFLLLIVAGFLLYQVIVLCLDAGLRLVNLGILEMMAPIIIVSYVAGGSEYLSKWAKMVTEKFLSIFIRIVALALMVLGIELVKGSSIFNNESSTFLFELVVIIGLLRLVKDLPNIISKLFGVDVKTGSGIKGRLGEMAGIGGLAQKAWGGLGGLAKGAAATAVSATGMGLKQGAKYAGKGLKLGANAIDKKFEQKAGWSVGSKLRSAQKSKLGRVAGKVADYTSRGAKVAVAGIKTGGKGTGKAMNEAVDKQFKDVIYRQKKAEETRQDVKLSAPIKAAAKGSIILNPNGTIDLNGSVAEMKRGANYRNGVGTNAFDVGNDIINNSNLSEKSKEILRKNLKNEYNQQREQFLMSGRQEMLEFAKNLAAQAKTTSQRALADKLVDDINNGRILNTSQIDNVIDSMDFTDRSIGSELLSNTLNTLGDTVTINGRQFSSQDLKEKLVALKSKWDSGQIDINGFTNEMNNLKGQGLSDSVINDIITATTNSAASQSQVYKNQAADIASKEGAIGADSTAAMNARLQKANEEAEKSKKQADELVESATVEQAEIKKVRSTDTKLVRGEFSDRSSNPNSWGNNRTADVNKKNRANTNDHI